MSFLNGKYFNDNKKIKLKTDPLEKRVGTMYIDAE